MSKVANTKISFKDRRNAILELLEAGKSPSLKELSEQFSVERESIRGDIRKLRSRGIAIEEFRKGKFVHFRLSDRSYIATVLEANREKCIEEKELIAGVATTLLFGTGEPEASSKLSQILRELEYWENLEKTSETAKQTKHRLIEYWTKKRDRTAALDSGSTNEAIAQNASSVSVPSEGITSFEVLTNSRTIFSVLGDPSCPIKAAILGGTQNHLTESIAGPRAVKCLESWQPLNIDISLVGTSNICLSKRSIDSKDEHDNVIKRHFLSNSMLRFVVADHSKFREHRAEHGFTVLPDSSLVSAILCDSIPDAYRDQPDWRDQVAEKIGTPILTGESPE